MSAENILFNAGGAATLGSGFGLIPDLVISSVLWTILQLVFFLWPDVTAYKLKRAQYLDLRNRQVSFVHGLVCIFLCLHYLLSVDFECGAHTRGLDYCILIMSCGYFSYDFLSMAWFGLLDLDMTIHHLLCISGMVYTLMIETGSNFIVLGLFVAEVSNPAMHMRIMLKHIGLRYSRSYEVAEFMYFGTFFLGRYVLGHPAVYLTITCEHMNMPGKIVCLGVLAQSYQFLYRMYFIVLRRFAEIAERNKKKLAFRWFSAIPQKELDSCQFYIASKRHSEKLP